MIRLLQIDYFLEVAEQKNFSNAAKKLFISQPALSKHISQLELELGVKLFERQYNGVRLTCAGEQLRDDMKDIRTKMEQSFERVSRIGAETDTPIRIGCFDGRVTDDYLPTIISKLHDFNPYLRFVLGMHDMNELIWRLKDDSIDIAITLENDYLPDDGYTVFRIFPRKAALVYSRKLFNDQDTAVSISDFKDKPLLIPKMTKGHGLGEHLRNNVFRLGLNGNNFIETDKLDTLMMNLNIGSGYSILSSNISSQNSSLRTIELDDTFTAWVIGIVKNTNTYTRNIFDQLFPGR